MTDFGHSSYFGHDLLWPQPFNLDQFGPIFGGQADFGWGQADFGQRTPPPLPTAPDRPPLDRPHVGPPSAGLPKIFTFFFLLPPPFSFFFSLSGDLLVSFFSLSPGVFSCLFSSLWGSSQGIVVVFWSVGTSNVLQREKKRHEKIPREREKKRMKMGVAEGKKSAKFWAPHPSGPPPFEPPTLRAYPFLPPPLRAPKPFSGFGSHPFAPPSGPNAPSHSPRPYPSPLPPQPSKMPKTDRGQCW